MRARIIIAVRYPAPSQINSSTAVRPTGDWGATSRAVSYEDVFAVLYSCALSIRVGVRACVRACVRVCLLIRDNLSADDLNDI